MIRDRALRAKRPNPVVVTVVAFLAGVGICSGVEDDSKPPAVARPRKAAVIEEIVVTAQKREQNLKDVPVSMSVVDSEIIRQQGITDFRDLALYVPNASVNTTSAQFNDVRIRGFGSPIANKAFEQSVGLVIDGVPYSRLPYWQAALFDLERVEVLRGPQGTVFGKNTTAGLFNVVTAKPTEELVGHLEMEVGELSHRRFELAVGGPVVSEIATFRLSGLYDTRDGFMKNTTAAVAPAAHERMNDRDRKGLRAQVGLPNVLGANVVLGYEHVESDTNGTGWEVQKIVPNHVPFYRYWDPNVDLEPNNWIASVEAGDSTQATIDSLVANIDHEWRGWGVHLIAGHSTLRSRLFLDEDQSPAPIVPITDVDTNPQTVLELRATSPNLPGLLGLERLGVGFGSSDVVAGVFFDERRIEDSALGFGVNFPVLSQFLATDATGVVVPCPDCGAQTDIQTIFFGQKSRSFSGFAHLRWLLANRWTLESGARLTHERSSAVWESVCTQSSSECAGFTALLNGEEFTASLDRSDLAFTPKVSLRYDWTDDWSVYTSWSKGYKGGGFNATIFNDNDPRGLVFEPEKATSYELGTKMGLFDRTMIAGVTLYRQDVTDLQVFTVTPTTQFEVVNAGEARSQGVEADALWMPSLWFTLRGALTFADAKYLEFPFGTCSIDRPDTDGDGDPRCDLSGRPTESTPRWTATLLPVLRFPLSAIPGLSVVSSDPNLEWTGGLTLEYRDSYYTQNTIDPRTRQDAFGRLGASAGIENEAKGWSLRVLGENLTDEAVAVHIREVSLVGKSFVQALDPPRLVFVQLRVAF